jgi:diketogulonate reductase-like aldo/keto reductase
MGGVQLGRTGERLSEIGLGTWMLGTNEAIEVEALRAGMEAGINFIDTAEMYGTEGLVGKAVSGRDGIFIATKVSPTHFHYEEVLKACRSSLARLGTRTIDLYQLHWPNRNVPIEETMRAMEKLVDDGKIRHIGVCNFSVEELREAQEALKKNEIVSDQVEYSIVVREAEEGLLDYCKKEGISLIAYSPLMHGRLFDPKYRPLTELLSQVGRKYGKTAAQVALNWLICKGNVVPIPKASSKEHVIELAGSMNWRLSGNDISRLDGFLSKYSRRPAARIIKPAINSHPAVARILSWLGSLHAKK